MKIHHGNQGAKTGRYCNLLTVIRPRDKERAWPGGAVSVSVEMCEDSWRWQKNNPLTANDMKIKIAEAADGAATRYCILNGIRFAIRKGDYRVPGAIWVTDNVVCLT
ncbi:MAG: hypothetical protein ACLRK9_12865 [Roseburia hominis]